MKTKLFLSISLAVILVFLFAACDIGGSGDDSDNLTADDFLNAERGISISTPGGAVPTGGTYLVSNIDAATELPYQVDFTINNNGEIEINFWGINDITDMDSVSYHDGKVTVSYADDTGTFSISPDGSYPFSVTLDDTAAPTSTYQIEIGISNKNDVTPNPYIMKVRFETN